MLPPTLISSRTSEAPNPKEISIISKSSQMSATTTNAMMTTIMLSRHQLLPGIVLQKAIIIPVSNATLKALTFVGAADTLVWLIVDILSVNKLLELVNYLRLYLEKVVINVPIQNETISLQSFMMITIANPMKRKRGIINFSILRMKVVVPSAMSELI